MSESLNVVKANGHVARPKAGQATALAEAGRQRGSVDLKWPNHPDAKPQARTYSEPRRSIVRNGRRNAANGSAEPMLWWRRQYPPSKLAELVGLPGVAGLACGEGCSREGGRPVTVLMYGNWPEMLRHARGRRAGVRGSISVTRERSSNAVPEVRGDHSSEELPVTGRDAKGLHFRRVPLEAKGQSVFAERRIKWAVGQ